MIKGSKKDTAYSSEFSDHQGLIHQLTKKCWWRLKDAGLDDHEYEDVFQLNCISFVKVARKYDPARGITFGAYLGKAIFNEFNKYAEKVIKEKHELGIVSYDDFGDDDGEGEYDFLAHASKDLNRSEGGVEVSVIEREIARENIGKLSKFAKLIIRELMSPSEAVKQTIEGIRAHAELAKQTGEIYRVRIPREVDIRAIKIHYGFRDMDIIKVKKEFETVLGVKIGN